MLSRPTAGQEYRLVSVSQVQSSREQCIFITHVSQIDNFYVIFAGDISDLRDVLRQLAPLAWLELVRVQETATICSRTSCLVSCCSGRAIHALARSVRDRAFIAMRYGATSSTARNIKASASPMRLCNFRAR